MIFNEIYSSYYNAVAKIITCALEGKTDKNTTYKIISEYAFGESSISIPSALSSGKWQLFRKDKTTTIKNIPTMPITTVQKRWLKAISLDPRIKLFDIDFNLPEDIEPLFTQKDYYIYDKDADGDPYDDINYITVFRTLMCAIEQKQAISLKVTGRKGSISEFICLPQGIEFSEKEDRFRLITKGKSINIKNIIECNVIDCKITLSLGSVPLKYKQLTLKVYNERNTLERCMLHFAHFEKRAEKADGYYLLHIKYRASEENEMIIRVLSFGPTVKVMDSEEFKTKLKEKLINQKKMRT